MHPILRLHEFIIPQIEGKFQSRVENNSIVFRPGRGSNIVRQGAKRDPTHPKSEQGEVGSQYTVFHSPDPHFLIVIPYPLLFIFFVFGFT
jgi:hypothetical protein